MKRYIISVDQSTSASKVFLLDENGGIVRRYARAHQQFYPKPGHVEHDAAEIWENVREGIATVAEGMEPSALAALAISNQRETTVLWDRRTGEPACPAVVWQDVRGESLCVSLSEHAQAVRETTGLGLSPYYPAAKAASVLRENAGLRQRAQAGKLLIGTVDSYLVYRLTGGKVFRTDISNAGRTQLMSLARGEWDAGMLSLFGIPASCLPEITPSDGGFGETACAGLPAGIRIAAVMGDSHAALFGQGCLVPGMVKATYGTGSSVMMNTGDAPPKSQNGLSACVGFGFAGQVSYALEGNVTCSGDVLRWLRDEAGILDDVENAEALARQAGDTNGVYLVPAFSGLGAPYFDGAARALLYGLNRGTTRAHIVRAALESMAFQDAEILEAMRRDTGIAVQALRVDGAPTHNAVLMQFQADLLGCPVHCAAQSELSALGVGYMAGICCGVYPSLEAIPAQQVQGRVYWPQMEAAEREARLAGWRDAVARCGGKINGM